MKLCIDCRQTLPLTEFYLRGSRRPGHCRYCKRCSAARGRAREQIRKSRPETHRVLRPVDPLNLELSAWVRRC